MRVSAASAAVGLFMAALMALGGYAAHNAPPSIGPANMWGPSIPVNTTILFQMQPRTGVALSGHWLMGLTSVVLLLQVG